MPHLVLFPQDSLILFLLADLLVVSQLLVDLLSYGGLALHRYLVFEHVLCVFVGKGEQPGGDEGPDGEHDGVGGHVNGVDPPVQPHRDHRHDKCVAVEEGAGLGGDVLVESLQQQLLLAADLGPGFRRHCGGSASGRVWNNCNNYSRAQLLRGVYCSV
jgi:hypothetical protein